MVNVMNPALSVLHTAGQASAHRVDSTALYTVIGQYPSGLFIRPDIDSDFAEAARAVAQSGMAFPNRRIVLNAQDRPFIVTSQLREQLQQLAEENTLTIGLRIANDPWALEFEPRDRVEAQLRQGPLAAIGLSLGSGNWREEMLEYVYRRARSKGKIVHATLGEYNFEYALIFTKDGYGKAWKEEEYAKSSTTYWLRDDVKMGANGTNVPGYAFVFVFGDSVPSPFRDFVGLHEFIESQGRDHLEACRVELGEARKSSDFFAQYSQWIHSFALKTVRRKKSKDETKGYFDRAVPDFTISFNPERYDPLEYIEMFFKMIS